MEGNFAKVKRKVMPDDLCFAPAGDQPHASPRASLTRRSLRACQAFLGILRKADARYRAEPGIRPDQNSGATPDQIAWIPRDPGRPTAREPESGGHGRALPSIWPYPHTRFAGC